ncbi:cadherin domain-containing protein, partial [Prosthecomicrobium sp. N25]|uniref:cadherin domain-containing protein n=1 Tax=Prosthecomicrobium sp. N25 TaxID=3129254 RepID=UPI0030778F7B
MSKSPASAPPAAAAPAASVAASHEDELARRVKEFLLAETPVERSDIVNANLHFGSKGPDGIADAIPAGSPGGAGASPTSPQDVAALPGHGPSGMAQGRHATGLGDPETTPPPAATPSGHSDPATAGHAGRAGAAMAPESSLTAAAAGSEPGTPIPVASATPAVAPGLAPAAMPAGPGTAEAAPPSAPPPNAAPTDMTLDRTGTVAETAGTGAAVATVSVQDPDGADGFTFSLVDDAGGRFTIDPATGAIAVAPGAVLDHETEPSLSITVRVTDSAGHQFTRSFTIAVEDRNDETPSDIVVTGGTIAENSAGGAVVATLSTVDADTGETFTYSLAGTDAASFVVVGNEIRVAPGAVLDFEAGGTRTFDLTVTDAAGHSRTETVTVDLTDVNDNGPSDILVSGGTIAENSAGGT